MHSTGLTVRLSAFPLQTTSPAKRCAERSLTLLRQPTSGSQIPCWSQAHQWLPTLSFASQESEIRQRDGWPWCLTRNDEDLGATCSTMLQVHDSISIVTKVCAKDELTSHVAASCGQSALNMRNSTPIVANPIQSFCLGGTCSRNWTAHGTPFKLRGPPKPTTKASRKGKSSDRFAEDTADGTEWEEPRCL